MNGTAVGFITCIISCFSFGFMFYPLRNFDCKDGFYVQWIECAVVFIIGFILNCIRGFPRFNPIAMIGGFLFATGNMAAVPLLKGLGISVGMLIWGNVETISGWSVARFGWFGTTPQPVYNNGMNIAGLLLTLASGCMFVFVQHETQLTTCPSNKPEEDKNQEDGTVPASISKEGGSKMDQFLSEEWRQLLRVSKKKLFFLFLGVFIGVVHGYMMTPITYIMDNDPNAYKNVLDYIFAHFCAIFVCSSVYFLIYCIYKRNHPYAPPELILPSVVFGIMWSIGMILLFVANQLLLQTVAFPITTRLPSTISVVADMIIFRTIKGKYNIMYATVAVLVGLAGDLLIAFSNQKF